ncbi:MAG: sugar ABC transporter ATP-binding protein [Chthoniobacteraceae bacterium]
MGTEGNTPLLTMRGIVKTFPGVQALRGVDLTLHSGEVLALLGENGAGKSTLMKILGGAQRADTGAIVIDGRDTHFHSPHAARRAGVAIIYQEFNLVPALTAVENIFLGQEKSRGGFIARGDERRRATELFDRLGVKMDLDAPCRRLTTAQQQLVEIAKALAFDARIIVMDEPTAALTAHEVEHLFTIIRDLRARGIGVIYISHRLEEIGRIADRVSVLRDGANVGERPIAEITRMQMIEMMVGRELKDEFPGRTHTIGDYVLNVIGLRRLPMVKDVSFKLRRGEIVALTGLIGSGRTETARMIFGADRPDAGEIRRGRQLMVVRSPAEAIKAGIAYLPEDRKLQGLVLDHSVRENFSLPNLDTLSIAGFMKRDRESRQFRRYAEVLRIKVPHEEERARNLSGGNQQKVVLAKWLARSCDILIFDEPTRGIDVGAKFEIYQFMNTLVAKGKAVLMISSELPEVLGMADRILVMHGGRITGEITNVADATQEQIMELAVA